MTHCSLPKVPPEVQLEEILGSRRQCRELTGQLPSSFAYPFGDFDAATSDAVRAAGFEAAYKTESELTWDGADDMRLPRIQVPNFSGREFSTRLRWKWMP